MARLLADILREFTSDIVGASRRTGPVWFKQLSQLNVAVPGAVSADMTDQAQELIKRLRDRDDIDFENDWKLVTIFIGANDLCSACNNRRESRPSRYGEKVKAALDILKANLPRTLVSLVNIVHVDLLVKTHGSSPFCLYMHSQECPCLVAKTEENGRSSRRRKGKLGDRIKDLGKRLRDVIDRQSETVKEFKDLVVAYQKELVNLIENGDYDTKEDFTVVLQRFLEDAPMPTIAGKADLGFFAPDCFHWSQTGHSEAAKGLWNNMFEAVGEKPTTFNATGENKLTCPKEDCPFIRTSKNSQDCTEYYAPPKPHKPQGIKQKKKEAKSLQSRTKQKEKPETGTMQSKRKEKKKPVEVQKKSLVGLAQASKEEVPAMIGTNGNGVSHHITSSAILGSLLGVLIIALIASVIYQQRCEKNRRTKEAPKVKEEERVSEPSKKASERTPLLDAEMTQIY